MKRPKKIQNFITLILFAFLGLATLGWVFQVHADSLKYKGNIAIIESKFSNTEFIPLIETKDKLNDLKEIQKQILVQREFDNKVSKAHDLLEKYNSPFTDLAHLFVKRAEECGGDYKILLAIAGNESGFGRLNYKKYNPFGYLDGVQYSGFEEAINVITCKISQRFIAPCNRDISCIVRTYAGPQDDKDRWVYNINWFINQI